MVFDYSNEKFSGVKKVGEHLLMSQIENNIKSFLDWGLLHIGGFINVSRSQYNIYGNPPFILKATEDPNYKLGQIWHTMRKDWVWEENIEYAPFPSPLPSASPPPIPITMAPISITGIYINNIFYPIASVDTTYSYKVDYTNSRIIFNKPIPVNSLVEMEYSYRWAQVYSYDNARWWQQLQYKSDDNLSHFNQIRQGDFSLFSSNRVQLPAVIIEPISRGKSTPWALGDKSLIMEQDLILHIIAETRADRNILIDIMRLQQDKFINLYDINLVIKNNIYPFNIDGTLNPNRIEYDILTKDSDYRWHTCLLKDIYASDVESFSSFLSESSVRITVELIFSINN